VRWQVKCLIDNCKELLPLQDHLRTWKRKLVGYEANTRHQPGALANGLRQVNWLRQYMGTLDGAAILEIGTGWEPLIPLVYRLAGARIVYLTDSTNLICEESLNATLEFLSKSRDEICPVLDISGLEFDDLLAGAHSGDGLELRLKTLKIPYLAPCDCRSLNLGDGSLDIISSRAVLEHIPETIIREIFRESKRLLKRGGVMCHIVDNSDHWEHVDKTISRVNFLQHSERVMRFTCRNPFNYQNRLRHQDYLSLFEEEGFRIVREEREIDPEAIKLLPKMKLAAHFKERPHEDLATVTSFFLVVSD
jgi:SAM-dependent methyltransferase